MTGKKRSHGPVTIVRAQAVSVMKEALESRGWKVTSETWDGQTKTESFEVRSRGVDTLIIVADPSYMSEPDPERKP